MSKPDGPEFRKFLQRYEELSQHLDGPIDYIVVGISQWKMLLSDKYFRAEARKGNPNIGGYRVKRGKTFEIKTKPLEPHYKSQ